MYINPQLIDTYGSFGINLCLFFAHKPHEAIIAAKYGPLEVDYRVEDNYNAWNIAGEPFNLTSWSFPNDDTMLGQSL